MFMSVIKIIIQIVRPPIGQGTRKLVALICLILGLGRLGLFSHSTSRVLPDEFYGFVFLALAGLLLSSSGVLRYTKYGKFIAILSAGALGYFGYDTMPNMTSAIILFALSYTMIGEAGSYE